MTKVEALMKIDATLSCIHITIVCLLVLVFLILVTRR